MLHSYGRQSSRHVLVNMASPIFRVRWPNCDPAPTLARTQRFLGPRGLWLFSAAQNRVCPGMVRSQRDRLDHLPRRLRGARSGRQSVATPQSRSTTAMPINRPHTFGIEGQGAFKKSRLRQVLGGPPLVEASPALEIQVHRIGMRRTLRSSCLACNEFGVQRVGEPRYDFVLHVEQIGDGFVEPLRPQVSAGFGIDELHVYAKPISATLYRAFEHVTHVQLAPDLPEIDRLCPCR